MAPRKVTKEAASKKVDPQTQLRHQIYICLLLQEKTTMSIDPNPTTQSAHVSNHDNSLPLVLVIFQHQCSNIAGNLGAARTKPWRNHEAHAET